MSHGYFSGFCRALFQHRMGPDHENAPQISIALFRDRPELLLAAGRILHAAPTRSRPRSHGPSGIPSGPATVATMADAPTMPIPGIDLSRLLASFERCSTMIRLSIDPIIVCTA